MVAPSPEAGILGEPSYVWRSGQERRLDLVRQYIPLEDRRVLDVGCGVGTYVRRLRELSGEVAGIDISLDRLKTGAASAPNLLAAVGEHLPFAPSVFDMILLNEVIEHVEDDRRTLEECLRVLRPGGHIVIFAPNRLYPFETHGIYLRGRYVFGNIPLVNYLPGPIRNRLVPHARAYGVSDMRRLVDGLDVHVLFTRMCTPASTISRRATQSRPAPSAAPFTALNTRASASSDSRTSSFWRSRQQATEFPWASDLLDGVHKGCKRRESAPD